MSSPIDDYLSEVAQHLTRIPEPECNEMLDEVRRHLETMKARLVLTGCSDDDAETEAVTQTGPASTVAASMSRKYWRTLGEVHRRPEADLLVNDKSQAIRDSSTFGAYAGLLNGGMIVTTQVVHDTFPGQMRWMIPLVMVIWGAAMGRLTAGQKGDYPKSRLALMLIAVALLIAFSLASHDAYHRILWSSMTLLFLTAVLSRKYFMRKIGARI